MPVAPHRIGRNAALNVSCIRNAHKHDMYNTALKVDFFLRVLMRFELIKEKTYWEISMEELNTAAVLRLGHIDV